MSPTAALYDCNALRVLETRAAAACAGGAFELMQRAGQAAWRYLLEHWPQAQRIVVACGPGNNGGDGYVLAALAHRSGREVRVVRFDPPRGELAQRACEDYLATGGHVEPFDGALPVADVVVDAVFGIEGLTNPRGFVIVDKHQRNPKYQNVFALGVCVAIPPVGPTPIPVGVPKTGFMIESMSSAIAANLSELVEGRDPESEATWNAICLADFGDGGVAFIAQPQIPPRNVNWSAEGRWVHYAKKAFEKYFLHKIRKGEAEPFYEEMALRMMGVRKLKEGGGQKMPAA
jgi:hypothetical protein